MADFEADESLGVRNYVVCPTRLDQRHRGVANDRTEAEACPDPPVLAYSAGMNRLLFGDNLKWLQDKNVFPDACVDLIYLDPPSTPNGAIEGFGALATNTL